MTITQLCHLYHFAFIDKVIQKKTREIYVVLVLSAVIQSDKWALKTLKYKHMEEIIFAITIKYYNIYPVNIMP